MWSAVESAKAMLHVGCHMCLAATSVWSKPAASSVGNLGTCCCMIKPFKPAGFSLVV